MQTFGKAVRNSLPAIGLGLLGMLTVTAVTAPAAVAQKGNASSKEFVDAVNAAKPLVNGKCGEAMSYIDKASSLAKGNAEKNPVQGMKVYCLTVLKKHPDLIQAIQDHMAMGVDGATTMRYKKQLAASYVATRNMGKAIEMTKEVISAGGGGSTEYAYVAKYALDNRQYAEALDYANKAIAAAGKEGKKPSRDHYNIILAVHVANKNDKAYYDTLEKIAPMFKDAVYWQPFVDGVKKSPKFKPQEVQVDVYRASEAAGLKLTPTQFKEYGELALNRGVAIESEKVLAPLVKAGTYGGAGDPQAARNKSFYDRALADANADKNGGLTKEETDAAAKPTGTMFVLTGESYLAKGEAAKAVELIQKGLAKGQMEPGETDLAKLKLGIAQMKAGKKDDARKTWAEVKADNGAAWLARVWTAISKG